MTTNPITLARLIWKEYKVSWALAKAIAVAEVATSYRDLLFEKEKNNITLEITSLFYFYNLSTEDNEIKKLPYLRYLPKIHLSISKIK